MKKSGFTMLTALALLVALGTGAFAQSTGPIPGHNVTIQLNEQNGSGQSGTATLNDSSGQLMVTVNLSNGSSVPQPAHIHQGTCANLNPAPAYPLTSVVDGKSETSLSSVGLSALLGGQYAINVHKSAAEASVYVACGDIVDMQMSSGGGTTSGGSGSGTGSGTGSSTGSSSEPASPGMPNTGSGDPFAVLLALGFVALATLGAGLRLARRRA
jgi:hypothetical protein